MQSRFILFTILFLFFCASLAAQSSEPSELSERERLKAEIKAEVMAEILVGTGPEATAEPVSAERARAKKIRA